MTKRPMFRRVRAACVPIGMACLAAAACSDDFDATRHVPARGSLGAELFGVVCDRMGGQSLHEDLSGGSYRVLCHGESGDGVFGSASSKVDQSVLPPIAGDRPDADGGMVSVDQQDTDRAYGVARLEALARDRARLIAALDATFPDIRVPIKDTDNPDPTRSCQPAPAARGSLHTELLNLLGRFTALYDDGTLPASTQALGGLADAFQQSQRSQAQGAWAHFNSRAGYRPTSIALGAVRPLLAYTNMRAFSNATLHLLSPDSDPYDPNAARDAQGNRVPVAGSAYAQLSQLVAAVRAELENEAPDPVPTPRVLASRADANLGAVLNRPRTDLEALEAVLFDEDAAFAGSPFATNPPGGAAPAHYVVQRDPRGYAVVPLINGALPAPFLAGSDGLPAIDGIGQFMTSGAQAIPTPFPVDATDSRRRDAFGRAVNDSGQPMFAYVETSKTFLSAVVAHLRGSVSGKSLLDSNPADHHETVMNELAGAYALLGPRSAKATRAYPDGTTLTYNGFLSARSPLGDLVYALGQILADPAADPTLRFLSALLSRSASDAARVVGDALYAKSQADAHPEARIPATSTFWDDFIDLVVQIGQDPSTVGTGKTRLLEDILTAFADPASLGLSKGLASQTGNVDVISYDRAHLNGPAVNLTTKDGSAPKTPPDPTKPDTGANRSELQRFAELVHDTNGVALCNKEGAILHAAGLPLLNTSNACASTAGNNGELCLAPDTTCTCNNARPFHECELLKIDNLARFYVDSIVGKASLYFRNKLVREGVIIGTGNAPGSFGASSVAVAELSSGIGAPPLTAPDGGVADPDMYNDTPAKKTGPTAPGFWDPSTTVWNPTLSPPTALRPKPGWINRQIHFDLVNDSPTPATAPATNNYTTNHFLADFQGTQIGTSVCPERLIPDPCKSDAGCFDSATDSDVAADGQVHGLRACKDGDWLAQRDQDTLFSWEENDFLVALTPLANAFASHAREDLLLQLMEVLHKHWQTAAGAAAAVAECALTPTTSCSKDGADTYEPLLSRVFSSDLMTALNNIANVAAGMVVPTCSAIDLATHTCATAGPPLTGIGVIAAATRALVDPAAARANALKDSAGNATAPRNDGTSNAQVTPLYLVLDALDAMDSALARDGQDPEEPDKGRLAEWKLARSQLVDEFLSVKGQNTPAQTFADPSFPVMAPRLLDTLREQLLARCGAGETTGSCAWARGVPPDPGCPPGMVKGAQGAPGCGVPTALWNEMIATTGGPTYAGAMTLVDAIRRDPAGRAAEEDLLSYLADPRGVDAAGQVEALTELLSTSHDLLQVIQDDANLVPLYHFLAAAFTGPMANPGGRSVLDSTTALLSRLAGHARDAKGNEICASEIDPNGVVEIALARLVTPMVAGGDGGDGGASDNAGVTPLEVIVDTIADVNRGRPSDASRPLQSEDYTNISKELGAFLTDPDRGLEEFYAIVRHATEPR